MKNGYIIENRIKAKDVDALNRTAIFKLDEETMKEMDNINRFGIGGGMLVDIEKFENGVSYVKPFSEGNYDNAWMAYNPSEHLTKINGEWFAGLSKDPRDYTNLWNIPFDIFKPQKGDIITFTEGNISDFVMGGEPITIKIGDLFEGENIYISKSKDNVLKPNTTTFKVIDIVEIPIPRKGIGNEFFKGYVCEVIHN